MHSSYYDDTARQSVFLVVSSTINSIMYVSVSVSSVNSWIQSAISNQCYDMYCVHCVAV